MAEKALVLSADPWEMTDEKTGEVRKGASIWYLNTYREGDLGQKPTKVSVAPELMAQIKGKLPAVCELEYGSRPGAQNKATLTVIGMRMHQTVDLAELCKVRASAAA